MQILTRNVEEAKQKAFEWVSDPKNNQETYWLKVGKYEIERNAYTLKRAPKELAIAGIECYELSIKEGMTLVDTFSLCMMSEGYAFP